VGQDGERYATDLRFRKNRIFFQKGLDIQVTRRVTDLPDGQISPVGHACAAQHCRDSRITAIYDGTNGIQSIDLLMRKLAQWRRLGVGVARRTQSDRWRGTPQSIIPASRWKPTSRHLRRRSFNIVSSKPEPTAPGRDILSLAARVSK
jgi:hypothetical protein